MKSEWLWVYLLVSWFGCVLLVCVDVGCLVWWSWLCFFGYKCFYCFWRLLVFWNRVNRVMFGWWWLCCFCRVLGGLCWWYVFGFCWLGFVVFCVWVRIRSCCRWVMYSVVLVYFWGDWCCGWVWLILLFGVWLKGWCFLVFCKCCGFLCWWIGFLLCWGGWYCCCGYSCLVWWIRWLEILMFCWVRLYCFF